MFVLVGQVERAFRGREAFQEIDQVATIGGLAANGPPSRRAAAERAAGRRRRRPGGARRPARAGAPLASRGPARRGAARRRRRRTPRGRRRRARSPTTSGPSLQFLACAERPVILAGGGVLRARTSTDLLRFAELLHVPVIAAWRRGGRHLERPSAVPRHGRLRQPGRRPRAARRRRRAARHRLPAQRDHLVRLHDPRDGPGVGARRPRAPATGPGLPPAERTIRADARAFLRGGRRPPPGGPCSTRPVADARQAGQRRRSRRVGGRDRDRRRGTGPARASIPAVSSRRSAGSSPTTRS